MGKYIEIIKDNLPKHPRLLGSEQYLKTAVLVPIFNKNGNCHLLFQERAEHIRQGGEICFPGGKFDERYDDANVDTAIRETCEETGIIREDINILGPFNYFLAPAGVIIHPYVGLLNINSEQELEPNQEVAKLFSVPLKWFINNKPEKYYTVIEIKPHIIRKDGVKEKLLPVKELGLPDKYSGSWKTRKHRIFVYQIDGYKIWGMTAELVRELVRIIKK